MCEPILPCSHALSQKVFDEMPNFLKNFTLCDGENDVVTDYTGGILNSLGISVRNIDNADAEVNEDDSSGMNSVGASAFSGRDHICFCLVDVDNDKLDERWILCDGCDKFFHKKCHFISDDEFERLTSLNEK